MAVITLALDASLMMMNRGDMWRVAGEASRQLALGSLTPGEVQSFVETYSVRAKGYVASVETTTDDVTTRISVPLKDISVTAWFSNAPGNISVAVSHRIDL